MMMKSPKVLLVAVLIVINGLADDGIRIVSAQSNYVQHGDIGNYTTNGLPEEATLDGKVSS